MRKMSKKSVSGINNMIHRNFKPEKCKTSLKLAMSRIKLMRNRKGQQLVHLRKEVAELLTKGQDQSARIRVEHVIREEKLMSAYDLIEVYCELIVARLQIIESQKNCPNDLKEAISSVIFASPRCDDIQELKDVQKHFVAKYGKEFVASILELRPNCGVTSMLVDKLSAKAPDVETKVKVLTSIAKEHNVKWEPKPFEESHQNVGEPFMKGSTFESASAFTTKSSMKDLVSQSIQKHEAMKSTSINEGTGSINFSGVDLANKLKGPTSFESSSNLARESTSQKHFHVEKPSADTVTKIDEKTESCSVKTKISSEQSHPEQKNPERGEEPKQPARSYSRSRDNINWNIHFKDAASAAKAAAESAERASFAARAAAELASHESDPGRYLNEWQGLEKTSRTLSSTHDLSNLVNPSVQNIHVKNTGDSDCGEITSDAEEISKDSSFKHGRASYGSDDEQRSFEAVSRPFFDDDGVNSDDNIEIGDFTYVTETSLSPSKGRKLSESSSHVDRGNLNRQHTGNSIAARTSSLKVSLNESGTDESARTRENNHSPNYDTEPEDVDVKSFVILDGSSHPGRTDSTGFLLSGQTGKKSKHFETTNHAYHESSQALVLENLTGGLRNRGFPHPSDDFPYSRKTTRMPDDNSSTDEVFNRKFNIQDLHGEEYMQKPRKPSSNSDTSGKENPWLYESSISSENKRVDTAVYKTGRRSYAEDSEESITGSTLVKPELSIRGRKASTSLVPEEDEHDSDVTNRGPLFSTQHTKTSSNPNKKELSHHEPHTTEYKESGPRASRLSFSTKSDDMNKSDSYPSFAETPQSSGGSGFEGKKHSRRTRPTPRESKFTSQSKDLDQKDTVGIFNMTSKSSEVTRYFPESHETAAQNDKFDRKGSPKYPVTRPRTKDLERRGGASSEVNGITKAAGFVSSSNSSPRQPSKFAPPMNLQRKTYSESSESDVEDSEEECEPKSPIPSSSQTSRSVESNPSHENPPKTESSHEKKTPKSLASTSGGGGSKTGVTSTPIHNDLAKTSSSETSTNPDTPKQKNRVLPPDPDAFTAYFKALRANTKK